MKKVSRATKLLKQIQKTPMRYGEMQKFVWELNGRPQSTRWIGGNDIVKWEHLDTMSRGYWCTNISHLVGLELIAKNLKTKTYHITEIGKLNIDKPFTAKHRQKLSLKAKLYRAEQRIKVLEHNLDFISRECNKLRKERYQAENKDRNVIVEIREYVNMVTRGIH